MPTPVSIARQCLTAEAAHALDEAVGVARRRGHAQTTSLHAVSALLSLPSSALREACARARGGGPPYPTRLQFKALELCLSVSLDRVPSGQLTEDPPVSNSLMAAIKRSQANQRRQPENFHLYHQLSSQSSINNTIKVELQQLIISILDDPVVSRVFAEAGFRSSEIKLAILRPLPHLLRYTPRPRGPPLFLCSLDPDPDPGPGPGRIRFPFSVVPGFLHGGGDANCRRIGEVLLGRSSGGGGRNPLLIGACAHDALREFVQTLGKRGGAKPEAAFPQELSRFTVVDIESSISEGSGTDRLDEVISMATSELSGEVLVVSFGDLKSFLDGETAANPESGPGSRTVARLTSLLEAHRGKMRLIGSAASNDMYSRFLSKFPAVEKEWELQLLPITTLRTSMAESSPRSSLMESFVPFAGFFSSSTDYNGQVLPNGPYQYQSPYNLSTDKKSEEETIPIPKSRFTTSVSDLYQCSLPSWLQMTDSGSNVKAKLAMSTTVTGMQSEWGDKFQQVHRSPPLPVSDAYRADSQAKAIIGFLPAEDRSERIDDQSFNGARSMSVSSSLSTDTQKVSHSQFSVSLPQVIADPSRKQSFLTRLWEKSSKPEDMDSGVLGTGSNMSTDDGCTASPASATSATTNFGPRIQSEPEIQKLKKLPIQTCTSAPDMSERFLSDDFKAIYKALAEKVGRQQEAVGLISETIARFKARNAETCHQMSTRRDMWLTFLGPDRMGKWKVAVSLCEILYGNREHLIHIDLGSQCDGLNHRGKTPVDIIAGELSKKPMCIVLLENVDRADEQVQSSLLQAILTGRFSDSRGREVGVHQAIFIATLASMKPDQILHSHELDGASSRFSEERVLKARGWPMKIRVKHADDVLSSSSPTHLNKRKLTGMDEDEASSEKLEAVNKRLYRISSMNLDLNLPAENAESQDSDEDSVGSDVIADNSRAWLLDFIDRTDANVIFKPYDFDSLAEKLSKEIRESFRQTVGLKCMIEIEAKVMEQLLSAVYRSDSDDKAFKDWMAQLLCREFAQLQQRYELTDRSTVRLLTSEDVSMEEQAAAGSCLPCRISVN